MEIEAGGRFFVEPAVSAEAGRRQQAKDEPNLARPSYCIRAVFGFFKGIGQKRSQFSA